MASFSPMFCASPAEEGEGCRRGRSDRRLTLWPLDGSRDSKGFCSIPSRSDGSVGRGEDYFPLDSSTLLALARASVLGGAQGPADVPFWRNPYPLILLKSEPDLKAISRHFGANIPWKFNCL